MQVCTPRMNRERNVEESPKLGFSLHKEGHIFFDLCQFKARATDQLISLDNPLMSSSYLGHVDERFLRLRLSSTGGS